MFFLIIIWGKTPDITCVGFTSEVVLPSQANSLEKNKLDDIWDEAINAARQRSVDLGKD